jgi:hypothetical protein
MDIRVVLKTTALILAAGFSSGAAGATVTFTPAHPTDADTVQVRVQADVASYICWQEVAQSCSRVGPDTLAAEVDIQFCGGGPPCPCAYLPDTYSRFCTFSPLPAGTYVIAFIERRLNILDPRPPVQEYVTLTVDRATPVLRGSWGKLKVCYR